MQSPQLIYLRDMTTRQRRASSTSEWGAQSERERESEIGSAPPSARNSSIVTTTTTACFCQSLGLSISVPPPATNSSRIHTHCCELYKWTRRNGNGNCNGNYFTTDCTIFSLEIERNSFLGAKRSYTSCTLWW